MPPVIPVRLRTQAVTVVPTLAPMIMLMDWPRVITPEFTKPTTMTVVAEELCITAVTRRPVRKPTTGLSVSLPSTCLRLLPARRSRDCPMMFIPKRKRLRPPSSVKASKKSIAVTTFRGKFRCYLSAISALFQRYFISARSFRRTSWAPPSTMEVGETMVSFAFSLNCSSVRDPQLHIVLLIFERDNWTLSCNGPAYGT